jgi:DNA repair exonuclease SbcCD nuclease subunit
MRFLHTADWQVGMKAADLGKAGELVRAERLAAAARVVQAARTHHVDFLLLAGDTFEDNAVDRLLVRKAADILAAAGRPVYLLPGNHDPLVPGSVWQHPAWNTTPNLHVLRSDEPVEIAGGWLFPCVCKEKHSRRDPTVWIPMRAAGTADGRSKQAFLDGIRIGIAHGTVEGVDLQDPEYPIPRDAAARRDLCYLALGHWHSYASYPSADGGVRMAYGGTHEPTKFGERDSGNVLIVEINAPGTTPKVTSVSTGRLRWTQIALELRERSDLQRLLDQVDALDDPASTLVDLRLGGVIHAEDTPLLAQVAEILQARCPFHRLDRTALGLAPGDDAWMDRLPAGTLRLAAARLADLAARPAVDPGSGSSPEVATRALLELYALMAEGSA